MSSTSSPPSVSLAGETISREDLRELAAWMLEGHHLTKGPETVRFESEFAQWMGSERAIFTNSGSSANLLMIDALKQSGRLKNLKAIAPAVSWVTTVAPLLQLGFDVQLCDCDPGNLGLELEHLEKLLETERPSLLILVHVLGHANHMKRIEELCEAHEVILLEDACETIGSVSAGAKLGTHGAAGSISFYYGHQMSTIEGGMVVTDDADLHQTMLSLRSHGWSRDLDEPTRSALASQYGIDEIRNLYTFYHAGYNLRSTDLQARLGRAQLSRIADVVEKRQENFQRYQELLPEFFSQTSDTEPLSSLAYGTLVENRAEVFEALKKASIETRPLICGNIGRHPFWIDRFPAAVLKNADTVHEHGLYLPNHPGLTSSDIEHTAETFREIARPMGFETE